MNAGPSVAPRTGTSRRNLLLTFHSSAAATLVAYTVNLAVIPFVLDRAGADIYGAWATISSVLAVGGLADAGIRTEIIRRVGAAAGERDDEELVRSVQQGVTLLGGLACGIALLGIVAAPAVRAFAFPNGVDGYGSDELDLLLRATILVMAVSLVANGYFGVLRGVQRGDVETSGRLLSVPISAGVTLAGVTEGWGLWALFLGTFSALLVNLAWDFVGTRRLVPNLRFRLTSVTRPVLAGYLSLSALALLSQIGDVIDSQWDKVVLSRYVDSTAVTSFHVGTTLVLQGKVLALLPLGPLLVAIAELRQTDRRRMENLFRLMAKGALVLGAVVLSAIFVFSPVFLRLWLGDDPSTADAVDAARLFTLAVVLNLLSAPLAFRAFGESRHRIPAIGALVNMLVNMTLSLGLTMAIGFKGALYGSIAGNLAGSVVFFVLMHRLLGDEWSAPPWRALAVGAAAATVAVGLGAGRLTSWPPFLGLGAAYVVTVGVTCAKAEGLRLTDVLSRRVPA